MATFSAIYKNNKFQVEREPVYILFNKSQWK